MQFKQGTHVFTSDGQDAGTVERVVLDPHSDEVSDLVVRKGWLFAEDKVVPIGLVAAANEERITLNQTKDNLEKLPEFEETYYVPASEEDFKNGSVAVPYATGYVNPVYLYPPVGLAWWGMGGYMGYAPDALEPDYETR